MLSHLVANIKIILATTLCSSISIKYNGDFTIHSYLNVRAMDAKWHSALTTENGNNRRSEMAINLRVAPDKSRQASTAINNGTLR